MKKEKQNSPSSQHLNQMLLRRPRLLTPPQPRKNPILPQQRLPRRPLHLHHLALLDIRSRRDGVEIEIFTQHDDAGAVAEHVPCGAGGVVEVNTGVVGVVEGGGEVGDGLRDVAEEFEHVLEGGGVVLWEGG